MKLRIVSDGTPRNTHVENAATGERLERVRSVEWRAHVHEGRAVAFVELYSPEIEALAEEGQEEEGMGTVPEGGLDLNGDVLFGAFIGFSVALILAAILAATL